MRELTLSEVDQVSGGSNLTEIVNNIQSSTTFGGTVGTVLGYAATGTVAGATKAGLYGGAVGFAGGVGWGLGSLIYEFWFAG